MLSKRRLLCLVTTLALLGGCSPGAPTQGGNLARYEPADHRGQWVVINYWAKWCKPCIEEIPELNELAAKHPEVAVLGVNFDGETGDELAAQVAALGIDFPLILEDPASVLGSPRPHALPTTLIVNPQGVVVKTLMGPQTLDSLRGELGIVGESG